MFISKLGTYSALNFGKNESIQSSQNNDETQYLSEPEKLQDSLDALASINAALKVDIKKRPTIEELQHTLEDKNFDIKEEIRSKGKPIEITILNEEGAPIQGYGSFFTDNAVSRIVSYKDGKRSGEELLNTNGTTRTLIERSSAGTTAVSFDEEGKKLVSETKFNKETGELSHTSYVIEEKKTNEDEDNGKKSLFKGLNKFFNGFRK